MRQLGKVQMEATLRRLLDVQVVQHMIYFETVVWAETKSLQPKGYFVLLLCTEMMHLLQVDEKGHLSAIVQPVQIPLRNVTTIERLRDPAKFLEAQLARDTQHIRLSVDDQVAVDECIDLYVIFEDSHIYCYLETAWLAVQMALAWPEMGPQSRCELALRLNSQDSATLFRALRESFVSGADRSQSVEDIAMVIGLNQFVKRSVLQAPGMMSVVFDILTEVSPLHGFGYFESTVDHVSESAERIPMLNLYFAALIFYFQLLSGGVCYSDRLAVLDGTSHTTETFIDAVLCLPDSSDPRPIFASQTSLSPGQQQFVAQDLMAKEHGLLVHEQNFSPIQRKLIEVDHLQTAVLFLLQKLIEFAAHSIDSAVKLESDFLLRHLLDSNEFCEKRIPRSFARVVHLLRLPTAPHHALFLYMHCFMLNWYCEISAKVRQIIRTKCFTEMQLLSGLLREKRTPNSHDSLFQRKGKELLQRILDNVLTDVDAS